MWEIEFKGDEDDSLVYVVSSRSERAAFLVAAAIRHAGWIVLSAEEVKK